MCLGLGVHLFKIRTTFLMIRLEHELPGETDHFVAADTGDCEPWEAVFIGLWSV